MAGIPGAASAAPFHFSDRVSAFGKACRLLYGAGNHFSFSTGFVKFISGFEKPVLNPVLSPGMNLNP